MYLKKPEKQTLLEMVAQKMGIKSEIAKAFGVTLRTLNNWIDDDEDVKEAFKEAKDKMIDFAESQLVRRMQGIPIMEKNKKTGIMEITGYKIPPSDKLIQFFLETKGSERGYGKKSSLDITSNGQPIVQMPIQPIPNPHLETE
jgi:hypothetical protein